MANAFLCIFSFRFLSWNCFICINPKVNLSAALLEFDDGLKIMNYITKGHTEPKNLWWFLQRVRVRSHYTNIENF